MLRRFSRAMSGKPVDKPVERAAAAPTPAQKAVPAPVAAPASKPAPAAAAAAAPAPAPRVWKCAKDPKTGRTYYYDVLTRETQWVKPRELQGAAEREALDKKHAERRAFFDEMEQNMRRNFEAGLTCAEIAAAPTSGPGWRPPARRPSEGSEMARVRTLSTVDDSFLFDDEPGGGARPARRSHSTTRRRSLSPQTLAWRGEIGAAAGGGGRARRLGRAKNKERSVSFADEKADLQAFARAAAREAAQEAALGTSVPAKPTLARTRNSTGTMFVNSTLDAPDRDATIKCVCHVLRAHMAAAAASPLRDREVRARTGEFAAFQDDDEKSSETIPTAQRLTAFYRDVFSRGQMEVECIVTSLIYVERLLKAGRGRIKLRPANWRPVLLSCMIMASKVCDDLSMWNADFSHICAAFTLKRINGLEAALLAAYGFNATVAASEYAKYYFHLRSMAARLGIEAGGDDLKPLDVVKAKDLASRSHRFRRDGAAAAAAPAPAGAAADLAKLKVRRAQSLGGEHNDVVRAATIEELIPDMGAA